jgi:hypothetical protein
MVTYLLHCLIRIMLVIILYMFITFRAHVHISDVIYLLTNNFYIKLLLKLSKFLKVRIRIHRKTYPVQYCGRAFGGEYGTSERSALLAWTG